MKMKMSCLLQYREGVGNATGELSAARALVQGNQNIEERDLIDSVHGWKMLED